MFKIQSGIPVPVYVPAGRPTVDFPFADLGLNDCFFVPIQGEETEKQVLNRVRAKAQRWKKLTGLFGTKLRVTKAVNPETNSVSIGVWRTA
jgi:hypothetical protein